MLEGHYRDAYVHTVPLQTHELILSKLMLQPKWRGAAPDVGLPPSDQVMELHGTLWHGEYGGLFREAVHRVATIQIIICETADLGNLAMLDQSEIERVCEVRDSQGQRGIALWLLGLKITGDVDVPMGAVSMMVPLVLVDGACPSVDSAVPKVPWQR